MAELTAPSEAPLLAVHGLDVHLGAARKGGGRAILVQADVEVRRGEIVGLIGETGSGKTTLARTIVGLIEKQSGSVNLEGQEIGELHGRRLREFRREGAIQYVFQDPLRSLDPDFTVERIVEQGLVAQGVLDVEQRSAAVHEALSLVGLSTQLLSRRPAQISGGQRQRVAIARALVMKPRLLILDEPVSALDASTRNRVLAMLADLRAELGLAMLIITHDLASLAGVADRVVVLYRGRVIEDGPLEQIFATPHHPYTALLIASAPHLAGFSSPTLPPVSTYRRLEKGDVAVPAGCSFTFRCPFASRTCLEVPPPSVQVDSRWRVACHFHDTWAGHIANLKEQ